MNDIRRIELNVDQATASALADARRREAVGRLVERMVRPAGGEDPLSGVLEATSAAARKDGLSDGEIEAELAAYNAERRA
jgi:hypothetical protein